MLRLVCRSYGQVLSYVAFDLLWMEEKYLRLCAAAIDIHVNFMEIHTKNSRAATFWICGI